jgi:hypothetical protein
MAPVATAEARSALHCNKGNCCRTTYVPQNRFLSFRPDHLITQATQPGFSGFFWTTYRFQQSHDAAALACCIAGGNSLLFQGAQVEQRTRGSLLADQFGLPLNFNSSLSIAPRITTQTIDFGTELRHSCFPHWYLQVLAPVEMTWFLLRQQEYAHVPAQELQTSFPPGYYENTGSGSLPPYTTIQQALSTSDGFHVLGRWEFCGRFKCGLANLEGRIGCDFITTQRGHLGSYFLAQVPTGTRLEPEFFFNAVVGNGQYWKVGGGVTGHYQFISSDNDSLIGYFEGNVGTLFSGKQHRMFDYTGKGCLSRYMLQKGAYLSVNYTVTGDELATRQLSATIAAEGEAKIELLYNRNAWQIKGGYNIYGRSAESLRINPMPICAFAEIHTPWSFKGCAGDAYFSYPTELEDGVEVITGQPTEAFLNATQSKATITSCAAVDNAEQLYQPATQAQPGLIGVNYTYNLNNETADTIPVGTPVTQVVPYAAYASNPPKQFEGVDTLVLDKQSAAMPSLLSHTIYAELAYQCDWSSWCDWQPLFKLGGEYEFRQPGFCCTLAQWGVWFGGSIAF